MIKWPVRALGAVRKLFEPLQDVDIYVEDAGDEVFYTHLFKRIAGEEVRVAKVFSLHGRRSVIDAAEAHDQSSRRALYLIDGDLDLAKALPPASTAFGLHQLNAYCIENYLICEMGATTILMHNATLSEDDAVKQLNFPAWLESIETPLVELFIAYAASHTADASFRTVSQGVGVLCTQQTRKIVALDVGKVEAAKKSALKIAEDAVGVDRALEIVSLISHNVHKLERSLAIVSGKDFLLPLLNFRLNSCGCGINQQQLRTRLAAHCDTSVFAPLLDSLRKVARGPI